MSRAGFELDVGPGGGEETPDLYARAVDEALLRTARAIANMPQSSPSLRMLLVELMAQSGMYDENGRLSETERGRRSRRLWLDLAKADQEARQGVPPRPRTALLDEADEIIIGGRR